MSGYIVLTKSGNVLSRSNKADIKKDSQPKITAS